MIRRHPWMVLAAVAALVVSAAAPAFAQFLLPTPQPSPGAPGPRQPLLPPPTQPAADPRLAQIKAALEREGLKVLDAWVGQDKSSKNDPQWFAETAGNYQQPSGDRVLGQAFLIWGVMYDVVPKDNPRTIMSGGQVWSKYGIRLHARLGDLTALVNAAQAAKSDAEKRAALEAFLKTVIFRVWDFERKQFVDQKDFVNKNFTGG